MASEKGQCGHRAKFFVCNVCVDKLDAENSRLREEVETLAWNLAACSTFALGFGIHDGYDKAIARPAVGDVLKLALKEERLRKQVENYKVLLDMMKEFISDLTPKNVKAEEELRPITQALAEMDSASEEEK